MNTLSFYALPFISCQFLALNIILLTHTDKDYIKLKLLKMPFETDKVHELVEAYPDKKLFCLSLLRLIQKEKGFIDTEAIKEVATFLELPVAEVQGVATFYSMIMRKRMGRYHIKICTNISCSINGSFKLVSFIKDKLGISPYEITPDGLFSFEEVECLAGCGYGPVMIINDDYYTNVTLEKLEEIIKWIKDKGR